MNIDKTPVSILQELMQQRNITPHYQLISEHGIETHRPIFVVRVFADGMTGKGTGPTKKIAKQEAARNFLANFNSNKSLEDIPETTLEKEKHISIDDNIRKSAVGLLKYYTKQTNLPSPVYEEISVMGPPHKRVFTYRCTIGDYSVEASSKTKLEARDLSALNMFEALKKNNFALPKDEEENDNDNNKQSVTEETEKVTNNNVQTPPSNSITKFHFHIIKNYMHARNIEYKNLWKNNLTDDYQTLENVLNTLGVKHNLTFMTHNGKYIAYLFINIIPAFYLIETGDSLPETKNTLATKMLFILRTVTK